MNSKNNQTSLANISKYLLIIVLPTLLILLNLVYLSFNRTFLKNIQAKVQSDISLSDRIRYTNNLIDYYNNIKLLDANFYSEQAQLHLAEVKNLLTATKIIIGMDIIVVLSLMTILVHEKRYEIIFTSLFYGGLICLLLFLLLGVGIANYFDVLFLALHKLLFTNTLWLFPASDSLIQVFPGEFFILFARQFAINSIITSLMIIALALMGKYALKAPPLSS